MGKYEAGLLMMILAVCMIAGGFSIPYGVTGALISGGVIILIWGATMLSDD